MRRGVAHRNRPILTQPCLTARQRAGPRCSPAAAEGWCKSRQVPVAPSFAALLTRPSSCSSIGLFIDLLKVLPADLQRGHLFQRYRTGGSRVASRLIKPRNVPFLRWQSQPRIRHPVVTVSRTLPAITKVIP